MKYIFLTTGFLFASSLVHAQFVAKMEVKEPIEGVCDQDEVYALFPSLKGQEEAKCSTTEEELLRRLNEEIPFLKENPNYKDEGMIGLIINCNGEVVQCEMDNKTKNEELDAQIEAVFRTLIDWKPGKLNGKSVDSSILYSFVIKKGTITLN